MVSILCVRAAEGKGPICWFSIEIEI